MLSQICTPNFSEIIISCIYMVSQVGQSVGSASCSNWVNNHYDMNGINKQFIRW